MNESIHRRRSLLWLIRPLATLLLVFSTTPARAAMYGDIIVTIEDDPQGTATHGYAEIRVRIENRSEKATREVKLVFPKSNYSRYGDYLRSITRTVTIEPGQTARVALAYPEHQTLSGSELGVTIDGNEQADDVALRSPSRSASSSRPSPYSYGYSTTSASSPALVLRSKSIDEKFSDWTKQVTGLIQFGKLEPPKNTKIPGGPGSQPMEVGSFLRIRETEYVRSLLPAGSWSSNWLGYSRYDGIVLTAEDLRSMSAEVRSAVGQYVECGGTLLVFGDGAPLPGHWKPVHLSSVSLLGCAAGFGHCYIAPEKEYSSMEPAALAVVMNSWYRTADPWQHTKTPAEANKNFPVVEDLGVPVRGLLLLMIIFAVVIGPANFFFLARRKRKLWLFWTVPLISFATCVVVLGYMVLSEGWEVRSRIEAFTVLDENSRRATTIGWFAVYTPLLPGGGLHFSPQTEVSFQNEDESGSPYSYRRRSGSPLSIDWTRDQHLVSGWLSPRVPSHFVVRKGESRRERVTITPGGDGRPEAMNGLGGDITEFWYLDEKGTMYTAQNIPAGGRVNLQAGIKPSSEAPTALRQLYAGEWYNFTSRKKIIGPEFLTPRTYLAFIDAAPFLDDAAMKGSAAKAKSIIFGILKEGADGS
jgi:hypothetical protein